MKIIGQIILAVLIMTTSAFTTYYIGTYWDVWFYVAKDIYKNGVMDAMYEYKIKWR